MSKRIKFSFFSFTNKESLTTPLTLKSIIRSLWTNSNNTTCKQMSIKHKSVLKRMLEYGKYCLLLIISCNISAQTLLITEVGSSRSQGDSRWFEIYNTSNNAVELSNYTFRTGAISSNNLNNILATQEFRLPQSLLESQTHVVIQGDFNPQRPNNIAHNSSQLIHVRSAALRPYWTTSGFVELIRTVDNTTVDFVRFGISAQEPTSALEWEGNSAPAQQRSYGTSLVRNANQDTNSSADWSLAEFSTPGGINDVNNCQADNDRDGIPDCAEVAGSTFAGMDLFSWGARIQQRDVFVEVDYMISNDEGVNPREEALERVVTAFARRNYVVHFDIGDRFHNAPGLNPGQYDLGGGEAVPFQQTIKFNATVNNDAPTLRDYKTLHMDVKRRQIFHYLLFANSQRADGAGGSSGIAEMRGNDLIVTLGNWNLNSNNLDNRNKLINFQAATIMHEIGHNFGFSHGGAANDNINFKPNYISIMNYLYQLRGLPIIGNNEADRYYADQFENNWNCGNVSNATLTNPPTGNYRNFIIDYSDGSSNDLNERRLNEVDGFGRVNSDRVDWNCNGRNDELISLDINTNVNSARSWRREILRDHDDWGNLLLVFQRELGGAIGSPSNRENLNQEQEEEEEEDDDEYMLSDDIHIVIKEEEPSQEFFRQLREDD